MTELIPFDPQAAADLDARFSSTMFRSTEDFINFYNSGLINKNAEEVVSFAAAVDSTFKNVKLQGKTLTFISKAEVELGETLAELYKWEIIAPAQDRLSRLVLAGDLNEDDVVEFKDGQLFKVVSTDGGDELERLVDEKFYRGSENSSIVAIHEEHSTIDDPEDCLRFRVSDLIRLDSSFISEIYRAAIGR